MIPVEDINKVMNEADCLFSDNQVQQAIDKMATQMKNELETVNPLFIAVVSGAMIPIGHLLTKLAFPLELDYIHATRYNGEIKGSTLQWLVEPRSVIQDRTVVIVDDILDEGYTLDAIIKYCYSKGATDVKSAVLVEKDHSRGVKVDVNYTGLVVPDRYVFGYGMDYKGYLRNADGIYAVKGL